MRLQIEKTFTIVITLFVKLMSGLGVVWTKQTDSYPLVYGFVIVYNAQLAQRKRMFNFPKHPRLKKKFVWLVFLVTFDNLMLVIQSELFYVQTKHYLHLCW